MINTKLYLDRLIGLLIVLIPISIMTGKSVADVCASLIAILFLIRSFYHKDFSFFKNNWVKWALILWSYTVIRSLFNTDIFFSFIKALIWIRFIFFAIALQTFISQHSEINKKLLITTGTAAIFLSLDSLYQYITGYDLLGKPFFNEHGYVRLTGPYSKMIVGYIIASLSLPLISPFIFQFKWQKNYYLKSLIYLTIISIIYITVFLTGERAALLQITCGIIMIILAARANLIIILSIILIMLLSMFLAYFYLPQEFQRQFLSLYHSVKDFSNTAYGLLWIAGIKLGVNNFIIGVGPNNFEIECLKISSFCNMHPHNIFIEWFAEYGIIGLSLFVIFIIQMLISVKTEYFKIEKSYYKYILTGLIITFIIKLLPLPSSGFFKNWYAVPFWYILGWMMSFRKSEYSSITKKL
jgi:O-antigen ligase